MFGRNSDSSLAKPKRSVRDDERSFEPEPGFVLDEISDDWTKLRAAIEQCANSQPDLPICFEGNATGRAQIENDRLEISIVSMLDQIIDNWRAELRRMIGTRVTAGVY